MVHNFSDQEKIAAFDQIAEKYFDRNFGTMAKADFETLLFSIYLDHLMCTGNSYSDYSVSKALGITQSKVRNLKMRKELQYPHSSGPEWKEDFSKQIQFAVYDEETRMVSMLIPDVNTQTELRFFIESNHWFDECPPNIRVFKCRIDFFLKICEKLSSDNSIVIGDEQEKNLKEIKKTAGKEDSAIKKILSGNVEEGMKELALIGSKEVICAVLNSLPFVGISKTAINALIRIIGRV